MESTGCSSHGQLCPLGASALPASFTKRSREYRPPSSSSCCASIALLSTVKTAQARCPQSSAQGKATMEKFFAVELLAKMGPIKWYRPTSRASCSEPQLLDGKLNYRRLRRTQIKVQSGPTRECGSTSSGSWPQETDPSAPVVDRGFGCKEILSVSSHGQRSCAAGSVTLSQAVKIPYGSPTDSRIRNWPFWDRRIHPSNKHRNECS
ncbi:hypothetical protein BJX63DRAFT_82240 [Aspergillus granulosus]|uniref:Uncharacterized protein n=1 Tax=Aspergillus granulosus TaxID=176169 RepID=A0ABR4HRA7_9EURO